MSEMFLEDGKSVGVTVVEVGPCVVTQVRDAEKDGYHAVQIGFGTRKNLSKAVKGHLKELGSFAILKEFRPKNNEVLSMDVGDKIDASIFQAGEKVAVSSITKGRGFQGVVKRHKFRGGSRTHGQKHSEREPGSIGSVWPQRVVKGKRMAGRMGGDKVTLRGIKIMKIDTENNILALKGAIPGKRGELLEIKA